MKNRTKEKIKRTFLKLLEEQKLGNITVIDITRACGVNRNTFYYYFRNIPALIDEIMTDYIEKVIAKHPAPDSFGECLQAITLFIKQNRTIFIHIYRSLPRATFERYLWRLCQKFVCNYWEVAEDRTEFWVDGKSAEQILRRERQKLSERDNKLMQKFFTCALFGMAIDGINNGDSARHYRQDIRRLAEIMKENRAVFSSSANA